MLQQRGRILKVKNNNRKCWESRCKDDIKLFISNIYKFMNCHEKEVIFSRIFTRWDPINWPCQEPCDNGKAS